MNRLLLVTAASLAAMATSMTAAEAQTNLVFAYWGDPAELPPFEEIVSTYKAEHPDIDITVQHAPWSGYFTRLDTQLAARAGPDVFFITNVPSYAARGQLEALDQWIADSGFPIDLYNQEGLKSHSYEGQLYSIPRDSAPIALYYNSDAFDEAGIDYPDESWDWNALREAALQLTQRDGGRIARYGLVMESNDWPIWVRQNGGSDFDDSFAPTEYLLGEPEAVEAIQFIGDLINEDQVMPSFQESAQSGGTTQLFVSGQAAMAITNAARLGTFAEAPFEWAVAPLPTGPDGTRVNRIGGAGFGMNAFSQNKEAAWDFLSYLAGEEGQVIFASAKAAAVPAMTGSETVREAFTAPFAEVFVAESEHGVSLPQFDGYVDVTNLYIQPALDLVWSGEATAEEALTAIAGDVNARLAQ
ncbi:ABC transporter substrate-binding protein [Devosia nitrariae]|uniref:sn-glycerol-3-phosphate-binding periplasmic protein UgpB n=1 Tax=Devosia nitrariae TaxID=2071872 RepID=A0ABQ5W8V9_9HYPH|nr:sugar ABC transporter substrate-binding protein [Devosia nitrariae]GLQ56370.1 sugar ABC transporter substrate-binding protein [Devosia nitrariae]